MKKALLLLFIFLMLASCGHEELDKFIKAENSGLPKRVDKHMTLKSVELKEKRVVYSFELDRMTKQQEDVVAFTLESHAIGFFKKRRDEVKVVWENNCKIRCLYTKEGKKIRSISLSEAWLEN
jgi:hypothetical protein